VAAAFLLTFAAQAFGQMATVSGTVKDQEGKPMAGAVVLWKSQDTGQQYKLKTDKKGQYKSIGISPGKYNVILQDKDGKELDHVNNVQASVAKDENVIDFDLQKEMAQNQSTIAAAADASATGNTKQAQQAQQQLTPEQKKQLEQYQAAMKENQKIKGLNQMLSTARTAEQAGNYDEAINTMAQATTADPTRDLLWGVKANIEMDAATKAADKTKQTEYYNGAINDYKKALELCSANPAAETCKGNVAGYHNNLGQAYVKTGNMQAAMAEYQNAANLDPQNAGKYWYNVGAVLTNAGKTDEANQAFDKAIQADPNNAVAYYQKGINLLAKATVDPKSGKTQYPEEAGKDLQKYLELQPEGPYAAQAKEVLASLGESVQTSYGKGKKSR
jgi:tetratricopeptide (TPR) repeat protein